MGFLSRSKGRDGLSDAALRDQPFRSAPWSLERTGGSRVADFFAALARETWMERGTCRDGDPEAWFPTQGAHHPNTQLALRICNGACPVRDECLAYALAHDERGIWGGTTERQRRKGQRARKKPA